MNCSCLSGIEDLASALARGSVMELYLTPKPGLVDLADNGSHPDLSVEVMECSIGYVSDYLSEIAESLRNGESFSAQKAIAIRAERRLYDDLGTNTHKGYIFLSGMLLIARHHAGTGDEASVRKSLASICEAFFRTGEEKRTNGERVRQKYHAGGIVQEAIDGYPSLFEQALPAFRDAFARYGCTHTASFAMMARLMQTVEDTTTLHRAGPQGMERVRQDGCELERLILEGSEFIRFLEEVNRDYIRMNITIGGIADMIGLAFGCLIASGELAQEQTPREQQEVAVG